MAHNREFRSKLTHTHRYKRLILNEDTKQFTGESIVFLNNGAKEIRHPYAKKKKKLGYIIHVI